MTTWVGTSWKMNKTLDQARDYARTLAATDPGRWQGVQPFVVVGSQADRGYRNSVMLHGRTPVWRSERAVDAVTASRQEVPYIS